MTEQYELSHMLYFEHTLKDIRFEPCAVLYIIETDTFSYITKELILKINKINRTTPILLLSRQSDNKKKISEKVLAIENNVDEYLAYPQSIEEIIASITALIRRTQRILARNTLSLKQELEINPESRQIFLRGEEVIFTKLEFDIIYYLASNQNRVITYKELYEAVWHCEYICDDTNIMAHIHRIRQKLEEDVKKPIFVQNVYGIGYRFENKAF